MVNFRRIGEVAQINERLLKDYLLPVLNDTRLLTEEEISALQEMKENLLDAYHMDNLDAPFLYQVVLRLCEDAERRQDTEAIIHSLDDYVMVVYALLAMARRSYPYYKAAIRHRTNGLQAVDRILEYLPPEKLKTLPEGSAREAVLINARYFATLYEYPIKSDDSVLTDTILQLLERALSLVDMPEYRELAPDYDWIYHEFRTLHYLCVITIHHNLYGFRPEQIEEINGYAKRLLQVWENEKEHLGVSNRDETIRFAALRCAYLAGEIRPGAYRRELRALAAKSRMDIYDADEMQLCTSVPIEYILTLDPQKISKTDEKALATFYRRLIRYIHRMPKFGHLSFLVSELTFLLEHFIEVEGGIDFEHMCMELLAALHPPTYVHSLSVADLSVCLARHLFRRHPEMFAHTPGYPDIEAIEDHVWHAAACHDVGKLFIVEAIMTYGRSLYPYEFAWIRSHAEAGAALLARHERTKAYAEVALGHQRWYNGVGGYPEAYRPEQAENRMLVDLVACADCLDAATDGVGRSYKKGKTMEEFVEEFKKGCGTRYAPFLRELLEDEVVCRELDEILDGGRDEKYRHTYRLLERVVQ